MLSIVLYSASYRQIQIYRIRIKDHGYMHHGYMNMHHGYMNMHHGYMHQAYMNMHHGYMQSGYMHHVS